MYVYSNPNNGNSLVNITNSGKIDSYYAAIYAYSNIRLNGTSKINITNTGDLNSTEGAGIVANSDTNKSSSTNIINNGNINAPIGIYTIAKSSEGNITVTIKNQKSIKASTAFKIDTKAYDTENVLIQNTGNIYADNIIQDDSENALIITNNNKTFENRGYVNGDFNNTTFDIQNYGKIALKTYNTSNVKSYTGEKDGELDINMKANENATLTYSKLHATNVTMEDGTKMFVNVKDMNVSMADRIDGKTLDGVVTSDNNITYNGNILVSDNSSLLDFNLSRNEQNISLNVITKKIGQVISNTGLSSLASVAKVLDNYKLGTNAELDTFKNNLYKLGTNEEVANAVASTTPIHVANISYMANVLNGLNTGAINSASGMNAGDRTIVEKNFWIKPFYSYIKQDNKDGSKGFAAHVKGVALGGDAKYNDESKLGLAFTYASTHQRTNDIDQRNNMDIYGLTAYGSMLVDSDTKLKGNVGINFYNVRSARAIETTTSIATANYTSYSINANAKVSRSYDINDEFKISPIVGLDYVRYHNPSYNETGAGGLNLHVDSFNENLLSAKVGSGFNYNIDNTSKVKFNIGASYDIVNNDDTVTASYAGNNASTFTTRGIKAPRFGYNAGVGYNKNITDTFSVNVGYNFERKSDFRNNQVEIKTNWKF
jgi:outer membrane autotransporter protein